MALILLIPPLWGSCQFAYLNDQSIEVQDQNGNVLSLPWVGELNAEQFNWMDIDGDGNEDQNLLTFLSTGS